MKLYSVMYKAWNNSHRYTQTCSMLSVGENEDDAIKTAKASLPKGSKDVVAYEIKCIFGHKITVQ